MGQPVSLTLVRHCHGGYHSGNVSIECNVNMLEMFQEGFDRGFHTSESRRRLNLSYIRTLAVINLLLMCIRVSPPGLKHPSSAPMMMVNHRSRSLNLSISLRWGCVQQNPNYHLPEQVSAGTLQLLLRNYDLNRRNGEKTWG